jgi:hypothetical protein
MPIEDDPAAGLTAARAGDRVVREHPDTTLSNPAPSPDVVACFVCLPSSILAFIGPYSGENRLATVAVDTATTTFCLARHDPNAV